MVCVSTSVWVRASNLTNFHETWYEHFVLGGHLKSASLNLLQQSGAIAILNMGTCGALVELAKFTFRFRNDAPQKCVTFIETMFVTTIREGLVYRDDGRSKFRLNFGTHYQTTRRHIPENGYLHTSYVQGSR